MAAHCRRPAGDGHAAPGPPDAGSGAGLSATDPGEVRAPETLEGWYSLHDTYVLRQPEARSSLLQDAAAVVGSMSAALGGRGWSTLVSLVGGPADLLVIHFRDTVEDLEAARWEIAAIAGDRLQRAWSQLGVTEAGLYHITAEVARAATERGGAVGDEPYIAELASRAAVEKGSEHVRRRLYPEQPEGMSHVSFYPMSKRRAAGQNWYALPLDERSRLMRAHGLTGRKYAGRVQQIITGAIGLSEWEWGVTLFARDLLDVKRLVTEMRFDEVSAAYAEFGDFYVGRVVATPAGR